MEGNENGGDGTCAWTLIPRWLAAHGQDTRRSVAEERADGVPSAARGMCLRHHGGRRGGGGGATLRRPRPVTEASDGSRGRGRACAAGARGR